MYLNVSLYVYGNHTHILITPTDLSTHSAYAQTVTVSEHVPYDYETPVPLGQFNTEQATSSDVCVTQTLTNRLYETSTNDNAGK